MAAPLRRKSSRRNNQILYVVVLGLAISSSLFVSWLIHPTSTSYSQEQAWSVSVAQIPNPNPNHNETSTTSTILALENQLAQISRELEVTKGHAKNDKKRAEYLRAKVQALESSNQNQSERWNENENGNATANKNTSAEETPSQKSDGVSILPPSSSSNNKNNSNNSTANICHQIPSSPSDWVDRIDVVLDASQDNQYDPAYVLRDLNAMVMEFITPRMSRSVEGFPQYNLDKLLKKVQARYDYLQNPTLYSNDATVPPPIRIYISGGSVADGQNCGTPLLSLVMSGNRCSWPRKLQVLVNNLVGGDMIEIINGARGGANTKMGLAILAYLLPPSEPQLDFVINAHSVNDQIKITLDEAEYYNQSLSHYTLEMTQNFTRYVKQRHPDASLIWLEDYLGNEQLNMLKLQEFSKQIHTLSKYYGFGVLSYTDAIRDVVYGDTHESALTPEWYNRGEDTNMVREVHPGIVMHICVTYLWLYYGWNLLQQACSGYDQIALSYNSTRAQEASKDVQWPRQFPGGIPPKLTTDLSLKNVTNLWRTTMAAKTTTVTNTTSATPNDDDDEESCPFKWTSGLQKVKDLSALEEDSRRLFLPYISSSPTTWKLIHQDFGKGRLGWAHYESFTNNSSVQQQQPLRLDFPFQGIQTIALFVAKSIDPDWVNSSALVTVRNDREEIVKRQRIHGYQLSKDDPLPPQRPKKRQIKLRMTRQVYLEEVDLSDVFSINSTTNLTVELKHLSGYGFKLMGMALCRFRPVMDGVSALIYNW